MKYDKYTNHSNTGRRPNTMRKSSNDQSSVPIYSMCERPRFSIIGVRVFQALEKYSPVSDLAFYFV
jgi:hypothetical protein